MNFLFLSWDAIKVSSSVLNHCSYSYAFGDIVFLRIFLKQFFQKKFDIKKLINLEFLNTILKHCQDELKGWKSIVQLLLLKNL